MSTDLSPRLPSGKDHSPPNRETNYTPPTVHSRNVSDGRNHWGQTGTAVNRIACPRRPHAHRRFRLLRPRRGSPTVRSLPRFSPFRSKVGANGMSRSLRLLSFHSRSSLTCAGRWQKKGNRFILPGFSFTISKVERRSDLIRYIVVVRSICVRDQRGRPKLASIPGSGDECVHACPCDIQPQIEQETKKACQTDVSTCTCRRLGYRALRRKWRAICDTSKAARDKISMGQPSGLYTAPSLGLAS